MARCSGEQGYFSDMTCSENPEPVFSEAFEAPQARCSGAQSLGIVDPSPRNIQIKNTEDILDQKYTETHSELKGHAQAKIRGRLFPGKRTPAAGLHGQHALRGTGNELTYHSKIKACQFFQGALLKMN